MVVMWRKKRGRWVPEDRLRATLWAAAIVVPFSVLLSGLTTQYIDGTVGLTLNLVLFFLNGVGVTRYPLRGETNTLTHQP